ncbi:tonB-system energizer ExbB [Afipia clevelandensis]|uniref:Biopolymer transport protein ExbB n=1 Tax=Afipia clevelandensis ATCC 49720 TaxID=883079 RepID=K8P0V1_9BRAD|nr:tonB-system energizer ExbB [Afipia clevelandensis]EKS33280.1 tonB-system energizer ExbB [Afipia clevelandensis ATCC 49720]
MTNSNKAAGSLVLLAAATSLMVAQAFAQTAAPAPSAAPAPAITAPASPAPTPPTSTPSAPTAAATPATPAPTATTPSAATPANPAPVAQQPAVQTPAAQSSSAQPSVIGQTAKNPALPHNLSPWGMFMGADIVVKLVMIGLAFASLVTWTICVAKLLELRHETKRAKKRIKVLGNDISLMEAERDARSGKDAVSKLVQSAAAEAALSDTVNDDGFKERVELRLSRVEAAMSRRISRGTGMLATIGATAPFVGLFGTVWGIMNSFIGISEAHTTNLAVVAPGIAEALLATAMGLIAAIPAVVIYNHLVRMITAYRALLGDATAQVMLLISRDQGRRSLRIARAAE